MVSAAEQLAANLNFGAFAKAEELKKRIWFTLAALLVYRLGTYIPIPGINPVAFAQAFQSQSSGILGMINMFAGGAIERMAIFALNIMPYISASIIMQLMQSVVPTLEALKKEGEQGRKQLNQYTRYLTVVLAAFQAFGIAYGLEGQRGAAGPGGAGSGHLLPPHHGGDPGGRHRVPDVARRADHGARRRQRHLAHHHGRDRGGAAGGNRRHARAVAAGRAGLAAADRADGADAGGGRRHRLHRARAAATAGAVPQAPDGQPHVPGRCLASAAQAQRLGRHPADLRLLAAAAADHGRELLAERAGLAEQRSWRRWDAASRFILPSTWR